METRTKLVVYNNNALGFILPNSNMFSILRWSQRNGGIRITDNPIQIAESDKIRLASRSDFDAYNVCFVGYDNPDEYIFDVPEQRSDYMLLGRLKFDCDAFLQEENSSSHLWAGSVSEQIAKMKELHNVLIVKPEWLTYDEILQYEKQMNELNK